MAQSPKESFSKGPFRIERGARSAHMGSVEPHLCLSGCVLPNVEGKRLPRRLHPDGIESCQSEVARKYRCRSDAVSHSV